ncbi:DUF4232 domain-containing protein [Actinokineospora sp. NBRC 105648]|uniref:DUF4232 domain-containing protein n=1 Tax=Actinokineospora sp. NBRC 105648 TaxID=3032206 RepID=UPI0025532CA6|nr:DUF4232 domain-containing protein [Actinokineospora sp. NBRC 105648]
MWGSSFAAVLVALGVVVPATDAAAAPTAKCVSTQLSGAIVSLDPGAGQRHAIMRVRNASATTCSLYGYGGLQLTAADGRPNPTNSERVANPGPSQVVLRPGAGADKVLDWWASPGEGEPTTGRCQPESTGLRVIPPDGTTAFTVTFTFGSVCIGGLIRNSAYYPAAG